MSCFSPIFTSLSAARALTAEQCAWEVMKPFRVFGPAWMRNAGRPIRQELPDHVRFCEDCGRPHDDDDVETTWRVAGGYLAVLPPQGPTCDTCGRRTGVSSTVRLARWGQGWRVVEWHRFDFLLLDADIWGTLDESAVSFLVEDHWEDETYRPGDEVYFNHLVGLFQILRQGAPSEIEAATEDIYAWISNEEYTVGVATDDELWDVEEDHSMPWVVDVEDLFMQQPQ
ncbi:Hypp5898 [Branchiostoma lanceolatum]|uniref:Hypp5898 protein n=1 Tax=Branchiostoma lanceolatum TaxID=7740 RepID=A0A8J9WGY1_BRALA|nr:Hypp5898 [Branchiostoma lanceolatum]